MFSNILLYVDTFALIDFFTMSGINFHHFHVTFSGNSCYLSWLLLYSNKTIMLTTYNTYKQ